MADLLEARNYLRVGRLTSLPDKPFSQIVPLDRGRL